MKLEELFKYKKIGILGLGVEGIAAYHFLRQQSPTHHLVIADQKELVDIDPVIRAEIEADKYVQYSGGSSYLNGFADVDIFVKSPGISPRKEEIKKLLDGGKRYTTGTNIFFHNTKGLKIGVTGSKGKSTTSTLIYDVLKAGGVKVFFGGNIGQSMLDHVSEGGETSVFVIELSSQQLEDLDMSADIAVWTAFFPDHLDYHGNVDNYFNAKTHLFGRDKQVVYNAKFPRIKEFMERGRFEHLYPYNVEGTEIKEGGLYLEGEKLLDTFELLILGTHQHENLLAVARVAKLMNVDLDIVRNIFRKFKGLEHRMEYVAEVDGVKYINDSACVAPESAVLALQSLPGEVDTIILGGFDRGYDFSQLIKEIDLQGVSNVALFPPTGERIQDGIEKSDLNVKMRMFDSMTDCVDWCKQVTKQGKICLLSPASPSFAQFKNFKQRGEEFKTNVLLKA